MWRQTAKAPTQRAEKNRFGGFLFLGVNFPRSRGLKSADSGQA
jgi:hypothetical protein